jgi:hypothetical protein
MTSRVTRLLVAAKAAADVVPAVDYAGLEAGTFFAIDHATGIEWAAGGVRAKSSSVRAQTSLNDAGSEELWVLRPRGHWVAHDVGPAGQDVVGAVCALGFPADVQRLWGWPAC